jgi:hypothetical protein
MSFAEYKRGPGRGMYMLYRGSELIKGGMKDELRGYLPEPPKRKRAATKRANPRRRPAAKKRAAPKRKRAAAKKSPAVKMVKRVPKGWISATAVKIERGRVLVRK